MPFKGSLCALLPGLFILPQVPMPDTQHLYMGMDTYLSDKHVTLSKCCLTLGYVSVLDTSSRIRVTKV